jgi:flagellar biosynthesis/type III secretory pathway M-ring protein FliF/YscJ
VVKWIVLAVLLFALVVLALAARPVLVRLPRLRRAALALQRRQADAEALRGTAEVLQERAEVLQRQVETTQQRLAVINAKRGR